MPLSTAQVQQAYVTFFARPADAPGLSYWTAYNGSVADLYATFAKSAEYTAIFSNLSSAASVNAVYQNLFSRDADPTGLLYWSKQVDGGLITIANLALAVSAGALTTDASIVANRVTAATNFTAALDTTAKILGYSGASANASAKSWLATVTDAAASLTTATAGVSTAVSGAIAGGGATGSTFTLATGVDNISAGSNGVVNGLIDQNTAANTTWNLSDSITATNGSVNLSLITAGATVAGYNTSGVTTLKIKPIDAANTATASTFDVGGLTGLTNVTVQNASVIGTTSDSMTIASLPAAASVTITGNGQYQDVTANYVTAATAGAADTVNLNLTGRNGAVTFGTGFETVAITGGAATRAASLTTSTAKTVTVTGSDLRIDAALDSTVTSIDASKATGTVNLAATPGATFSAKGGAGTSDVLAVSSLTSTQTVTGFETLVATAAATYDLTLADIVNFGVGVGAGAVSITNASAIENNIVIGGLQQRTTAPAATGNLTTGGTLGFAFKTATGTADTVNIAVNNGGTASTGTMTIGGTTTANAIEAINISTADWATVVFGGISAAPTATGSLTLKATGSGKLTLGTVAVSAGVATGTTTIDLSGNTGSTQSLTLTDSAGDNLTFTGGAGATTLTTSDVAAAKTGTYTTGAGADVITVTAPTAAGTVNVVAGAGDDRIQIGATSTTALLLSLDGGAGTDTLATTGALGGAITVAATIAGFERINLESTGKAATLNLTVANGYADTVLITDVSGQNETINLVVSAAGGTVSATNFTALGWTNGTDVLSLTGSTGAETLTASATLATSLISGAGADILNMGTATHTVAQTAIYTTGTTAAAANMDTLNNFVSTVDKIQLTGTTGLLAGLTLVPGTTTAATFATGIVDATAVNSTADVYTAIAANAAFSQAGNFAVSAATAGGVVAKTITFANGSAAATYLVINDSTAAFQAANDVVIKLTGTSTVVAADITFVA